ncbi:5'-methylthioadenosine/S-adenosylhomocysteine nucleosidase [Campylobacter canadensis]|uniref:5'-methylthioadenosine/S-adenosylhomocysteine nucleosidase n=1 Tax=Campylobacter canadensis TaxID=449520 RepID=UPI001CCAEB47|nr:5'-methylthioadenosine/S-adenosylhomocysteine nucleosidase [Campylobacter canadensis]MBZ7996848.1 5'-methylthioadenosine/S-adenosylhomocysteine nucleosidase [Campylobacter canadensis]MBZ7999923.1 5'-methylthioadenosine/S-adenosylhomocysteine nucleosidase [Campylobacter canadensis]MBZ8001749.1 5'-methylthioadenosine/S-adenosylhomocysteine nucleosidase [Campylobacter canadensis]MBZ8004484.1 5'-methylthioadenosine/S-adenosylhomocysteine nucleosidase [Campylobacter canadensis]
MKKLFFIVLMSQVLLAKILVQGAMTSETNVLIDALKDKKEIKIGSYLFYTGKIGSSEVIVSRTLVGMVNAASATTIGILNFKPDIIINQGTAGAHNQKLNTGDIVIGEKIYNAGSYYTEQTDSKKVTYKTRKQMLSPTTLLTKDNEDDAYKYFTSDEKLVKDVLEYSRATKFKVISGVIATADAYNRETEVIKHIRSVYNSDAEEMESSSVAQVAKAFNIPYLAIRIISNVEPKKQSFDVNTTVACQEFVINFIKYLDNVKYLK